MTDSITTTEFQMRKRVWGSALVLSVNQESRIARLYYAGDDGVHELDGIVALQFPRQLGVGDRVLITGESHENIYIIGLLNSAQQEQELRAPDGSCVRIIQKDDVSVIQVFSPRGGLIVEYDCSCGKTRIGGKGDIEISSAGGRLNLAAREEIALHSRQVTVKGQSSVSLSAGQDPQTTGAQVHINEQQLGLKGEEINISGQRGIFHFGEYRLFVRKMITKALQIRIVADRMETTAVSVFSRARDWYQTATSLVQIKSGRLRLLSEKSYFQKSRSSVIKAEEDVKVKAEKIHLG